MILKQKFYSLDEIDPEFIPGIESLLSDHIPSFEYLKQQLSRNSIAFGMVNTLEDLSNHFAIKRQWVRTSFDQKVSFPEGPLKRNFTKGPSFQESLRSPFLGEHTQSIKKEFSES